MSKYLELFKGAFDDSIGTKTKPENKPYIGYSLTDGIVYTVVPKPVTGPADNEIWYTTVDGDKVILGGPYLEETPSFLDMFGANEVSHNYDNLGIIKCDNPIIKIDKEAFVSSSIKELILPNTVEFIGLGSCRFSEIQKITIGSNLSSIKLSAFMMSALNTINYQGTTTQWEAIEKGEGWNSECSEITVHCTDGDITIPANS